MGGCRWIERKGVRERRSMFPCVYVHHLLHSHVSRVAKATGGEVGAGDWHEPQVFDKVSTTCHHHTYQCGSTAVIVVAGRGFTFQCIPHNIYIHSVPKSSAPEPCDLLCVVVVSGLWLNQTDSSVTVYPANVCSISPYAPVHCIANKRCHSGIEVCLHILHSFVQVFARQCV